MTLRIPAELHEQLRNDAKDAKVALSQYVADLLALQAGRPTLPARSRRWPCKRHQRGAASRQLDRPQMQKTPRLPSEGSSKPNM